MGLTDRVINIAKGYLDKASDRWQQIDSRAQQELDEYINRAQPGAWERAQAKIAALQSQREPSASSAQTTGPAHTASPAYAGQPTPMLAGSVPDISPLAPQAPESQSPSASPAASSATVDAAYKVLGVAPRSNMAAVRDAYQRLTQRAAPSHFPDGSPEQAEAMRIERRAMTAYMLLADTLSPADDRFDRLEI